MNLAKVRAGAVKALAVVGALALACGAYLGLTPEPADLLPERLAEVPEAEGEPLATVATHLGAPVLPGNRVELLVNGREIFPAMLEAIRSAERTVDFLTYVYWDGHIAREFAHALADASRRGVNVRVLLDAFASRQIPEELVRLMEDAGCRVAWYHPLAWYHIDRFNHRTHRKILVVDGRVGFTGGVGIAAEWSGDAERPGRWRDDHFRMEGPVVHYLRGGFAENWLAATGEVVTWEQAAGEADPGDADIVPVFASPQSGTSPVAFTYWAVLRSARSEVDIATPYFLPDSSLVGEMVETTERGVRVRLLVPGKLNDSDLVRNASFTRYRRLLEAGVEIHEFRPTMMHTKLLRVDDDVSVIGSANLDNRSFELNDELILVVRDSSLSRDLEASFERDLERADRIMLEQFEERSAWDRLVSRLALLLRKQL